MDKERVFQLIWISIVLGGFLTIVYVRNGHMDLVKKNLKVTKGRVYNTSRRPKGGMFIDVVFVVNGQGYTTGKSMFKSFYQADKFKNTYWDVAYDSLNPEHSELLIWPDDYKEYSLDYPDSISWVLGLHESF